MLGQSSLSDFKGFSLAFGEVRSDTDTFSILVYLKDEYQV